MEKRSRRRTRDLVTQAASQGLSENEIGCARISMMARSTNAPFKGRIQKRKTNHLQIITFGLQRTAGPYKSATKRLMHRSNFRSCNRAAWEALAGYVHCSAAAGLDEGRINLPPFPYMLRFRELLCSRPTGRSWISLRIREPSDDDNLLMVTKKRTFVLEL